MSNLYLGLCAKIKFNDKKAASTVLISIGLYILFYGITIAHGFHLDVVGTSYVLTLIPIFLVDSIKTTCESLLSGSFLTGNEDISKVTVVIPTYNGNEKIKLTLSDLLKRFAPERVIVVANGCTDNTPEIVKSFGVKLISTSEPIGKVRAINEGMKYVETPYTLIIDDDTLIGSAHLPTGLLDEGYSGVAFRVLPVVENWITKLQLYEYKKSMDVARRFHNCTATVQNVSGAIGLFPTQELIRQISLHTGEFCGEDLQRTLLIHLNQPDRGVVITDSVVETLVPNTFKDLHHQRVFGWYPGLLCNFKNYLNLMTSDKVPFKLRFDAFYNCFLVLIFDVLRLLTLPILVFYPGFMLLLYFAYLFCESITFLSVGTKSPLWVLLIYPFYGLFSFITRVEAAIVFAFRRVAVRLSKSNFLDDYKRIPPHYSFIAYVASVFIFFCLLSLRVGFTKLNTSMVVTQFKIFYAQSITQPITAQSNTINSVNSED